MPMLRWMTVCVALLIACAGKGQNGAVGAESTSSATQSADSNAPIRVLVVTATQGFRHGEAIDVSKARLKQAEASSNLRFDFTEDPTSLSASTLARYDVLFLNNSTLRIAPANPSDAAARAAVNWPPTGIVNAVSREQQYAIASFVRDGKGLVVVHAGIDAMYGWTGFRDMVGGGLFQSHPYTREAQVRIEDPSNAAMSHLGPSVNFKEEYYVLDVNPRPNSHMLMSLDLASVGDTIRKDYPLAFIRRYAKGRVFVNVLGHFPDTWRRDDYLTSILQGIRIAAGRLPADFSTPTR